MMEEEKEGEQEAGEQEGRRGSSHVTGRLDDGRDVVDEGDGAGDVVQHGHRADLRPRRSGV